MTAVEYEIRIAGVVPAEVLEDLSDARITRQGVETVLRGPLTDQAALVGLINWLQSLGIDIHEVRQIDPGPATDDAEPEQPS